MKLALPGNGGIDLRTVNKHSPVTGQASEIGCLHHRKRAFVTRHAAIRHKAVVAGGEVERHTVRFIAQFRPCDSAGGDISAVAVVDIQRKAIHLSGKRIGEFHVVVVDKPQRHAIGARIEIIVDKTVAR